MRRDAALRRQRQHRHRRQRGVALVVVLLLSLLWSLVVLGVARQLLVNESGLGAAADHALAFDAATALLRDAEADVLGAWPDGSPCGPPGADAGCRRSADGVYFPVSAADRDRVAAAVADPQVPCRDGVCVPAWAGQMAGFENRLAAFETRNPPSFATYGRFTQAVQPGTVAQQNPLLADQARYWVEVLDYAVGAGIADGGSRHQPDALRPFVFRITAIVRGRRPGTRVVLRELFVPSPLVPPP